MDRTVRNPEPRGPMPRALPGFGAINRYWDDLHGMYAAKLLPGEFYVTIEHETIVTVLGSCVSACIRDRESGVGGMNHFMLPASLGSGSWEANGVGASTRYGTHAMERLINEILKHGGRRESLEVKLTGGGRVLSQMTDVGYQNIRFVQEYVRTECLRVISQDLGDIYPRKVYYTPASGRLFVKKLRTLHNNTVLERETRYLHEIEAKPVQGEVELF